MLKFFNTECSISISIKEIDKDSNFCNINIFNVIVSQKVNNFLCSNLSITTSINSVEKGLRIIVTISWQFLSSSFKVTFSSTNSYEEISKW